MPLEVRSNENQFHYPKGLKGIEDGKQLRSERPLCHGGHRGFLDG